MKNGPNELWFRHVIFFLEGLSENIIKDRGKKFCLNFGCRAAYDFKQISLVDNRFSKFRDVLQSFR